VQVENAFTRRHEGTGLGLALVKKYIALHGGHLDIESAVGRGTRIAVIFPPERVIGPADDSAAKESA
jgi:signal transduction histidine kinase